MCLLWYFLTPPKKNCIGLIQRAYKSQSKLITEWTFLYGKCCYGKGRFYPESSAFAIDCTSTKPFLVIKSCLVIQEGFKLTSASEAACMQQTRALTSSQTTGCKQVVRLCNRTTCLHSSLSPQQLTSGVLFSHKVTGAYLHYQQQMVMWMTIWMTILAW